jgi:hypothetical protein
MAVCPTLTGPGRWYAVGAAGLAALVAAAPDRRVPEPVQVAGVVVVAAGPRVALAPTSARLAAAAERDVPPGR